LIIQDLKRNMNTTQKVALKREVLKGDKSSLGDLKSDRDSDQRMKQESDQCNTLRK